MLCSHLNSGAEGAPDESEDILSTSGLNYNASPETTLTNLVAQKLRAENIVKGGASWFVVVAGLSMLNSVLSLSGAGIRLIFG